MSNFVTAREPEAPIRVKVDHKKFIEDGLLRAEITGFELVLGTSPSWENVQSWAWGYSKSEKYIAQLRRAEDLLTTIWIGRQINFIETDRISQIDPGERRYWENENGFAVPVITDQFTEEPFWGQGLNGVLISLANERYKKLFGGVALYSSLHFTTMADRRQGQCVERYGSKRVWEKLESKGLAQKLDWFGDTRWKCI